MEDKSSLPGTNTAELLHLAYLKLADHVNAASREFDPQVRPAHTTVFLSLEPDGLRLTRLAEKAQMSPQAMGELVDDLEALGYLRRVPDPSDRRAKLILFTDRSHELMGVAWEAIREVDRRLVKLLGKSALDELHRTLGRVVEEY